MKYQETIAFLCFFGAGGEKGVLEDQSRIGDQMYTACVNFIVRGLCHL